MRGALLLAALLACAWFALVLRSLHEQATVQAFLGAHPRIDASQARSLEAEIGRARFLNPDEAINTLDAYVQVQAQHLGRAVAIFRQIALREPQNVENWTVLEFLTGDRYPQIYRQAVLAVQALAPPVPASR